MVSAAKQKMYTPKSDDNPWHIDEWKTTEEWLQIALWYPFSIHALIQIDGRWLEEAICSSRNRAYHVLKDLAARHPDQYYIVVQKYRYGKEGCEKAILFAPGSEQMVIRAMEAGKQAKAARRHPQYGE